MDTATSGLPPPRPTRRAQARLMRQLLTTPQTALDELASTCGPIASLGARPVRLAVVGSPALIRELLLQPNDHFRWGTPLSPFPFVVGPLTMIASDGADHRRRRGAVMAAFSRRRIERWIPMILDRADVAIDDLVRRTDPGVPVDLYPVGRRLLIDIVVRALFGERLSQHIDEIDARFRRSQDYLERPLYRQVPHPIPFTERAAVRRDRRELDALIDSAIDASRRDPPPDPDDTGDVIDALVHRSDLSDAEIRDQVKSLIGAGYDTTASSLAWILWEATLHEGWWDALAAEADVVLGPVGPVGAVAGIGPQHVAALDLAHRTMRETLRLHPASGVGAREAAVDVPVGRYVVPRGTLVLWSPYLAGRDAIAFDRADEFEPARFVGLDDDQRRLADEAWVPFGRGPRMCVGFALAQMELTLIVARLAQRLVVRPAAMRAPDPVGLVVSRPQGGAPMLVASRAADDETS